MISKRRLMFQLWRVTEWFYIWENSLHNFTHRCSAVKKYCSNTAKQVFVEDSQRFRTFWDKQLNNCLLRHKTHHLHITVGHKSEQLFLKNCQKSANSKRTQTPRPSQRKHEMMSQIPKFAGNCRKINAVRTFSDPAFSNTVHPFVPPVCVCIAINCLKLLSTHFL